MNSQLESLELIDEDFNTESNKAVFSAVVKKQILLRDNYSCVRCGKSKANGVELHVDHIKPTSLGGKGTLENGQTICSPCNMFKKSYNQTESGKRDFLRMLEIATKENDQQTIDFCKSILETYERFGVNCHIEWRSK